MTTATIKYSQLARGHTLRAWFLAGKITADNDPPQNGDAIHSLTDDKAGVAYSQGTADDRPTFDSSLQAGTFDRTSDRLVHVGTPLSNALGTWHIRFRTGSNVSARQSIFGVFNSGAINPQCSININSAKLEILIRNSDSSINDRLDGNTTIEADADYVITVSTDGSEYTALVNAVTQTLTAAVGGNNGHWVDALSLNNVCIGARNNSTVSQFFGGKVMDAHAYEGFAHTDDEISQVHEQLMFDAGLSGGVNHARRAFGPPMFPMFPMVAAR